MFSTGEKEKNTNDDNCSTGDFLKTAQSLIIPLLNHSLKYQMFNGHKNGKILGLEVILLLKKRKNLNLK